MALFPDAQRRAQVELDEVVGPTRLPDFDDIEQLPFIRAIMMETLRWIPVTPIGIPHAVTADDEYKGQYIPKGSMVIPVRLPYLSSKRPRILLITSRSTECLVSKSKTTLFNPLNPVVNP